MEPRHCSILDDYWKNALHILKLGAHHAEYLLEGAQLQTVVLARRVSGRANTCFLYAQQGSEQKTYREAGDELPMA